MSERVFMRWPTELKEAVEARAGQGNLTQFTTSAVEWALKFDPCPKCGVPRPDRTCWSCE